MLFFLSLSLSGGIAPPLKVSDFDLSTSPSPASAANEDLRGPFSCRRRSRFKTELWLELAVTELEEQTHACTRAAVAGGKGCILFSHLGFTRSIYFPFAGRTGALRSH